MPVAKSQKRLRSVIQSLPRGVYWMSHFWMWLLDYMVWHFVHYHQQVFLEYLMLYSLLKYTHLITNHHIGVVSETTW